MKRNISFPLILTKVEVSLERPERYQNNFCPINTARICAKIPSVQMISVSYGPIVLPGFPSQTSKRFKIPHISTSFVQNY